MQIFTLFLINIIISLLSPSLCSNYAPHITSNPRPKLGGTLIKFKLFKSHFLVMICVHIHEIHHCVNFFFQIHSRTQLFGSFLQKFSESLMTQLVTDLLQAFCHSICSIHFLFSLFLVHFM